jgi:hypothetical protein
MFSVKKPRYHWICSHGTRNALSHCVTTTEYIMTFEELMGDYIPEEFEKELCPRCGCKITVTKFDDDAWGNTRTMKEKTCSDEDCGWTDIV